MSLAVRALLASSFALPCSAAPAASSNEPVAEWIWSSADADDACTLGRAFALDAPLPTAARLLITCDNHFDVRLNGEELGSNGHWEAATVFDVADRLAVGENVLEVECSNWGGPAGLLVRLDVAEDARAAGEGTAWTPWLVSDATWRVGGADGETAAHSFGRHTDAGVVWSDPFVERPATPAEEMTALDGFTVELVRGSRFGEGSWVSMTFDPEGRVVCGREEGGLLRLDVRDRAAVRAELFPDLFRGAAQGLLFAHGGLYANVNTGRRDADGGLWFFPGDEDGGYGDGERRFAWHGGGEHGCHGVVLGPDGALWLIHGNMVSRPETAPSSPHRNFAEDLLSPREWDPNGHARGVLAPGSHVLRLAADGTIELWAAGMRNAYDLAFSPEGDLFTFDSDMEWDVGLPWYRPTRIVHVVRAGEYGWRSGSGKWPAHYPDSLPGVVDVGRGSPTGVRFGAGAAFPPRYRRALFAGDWSEGRILAVHLEARGTSYSGSFEAFLTGTPLNVTDLEIGPDGALWFTTGGRGTQSGLYRVAWAGGDVAAVTPRLPSSAEATATGERPTGALVAALGSDDRFARYAARVELESRPTEEWLSATSEASDVDVNQQGMLAAVRVGAADAADVLATVGRHPFTSLSRRQRLDELRIAALALVRGGLPDEATRAAWIERVSPWPGSDDGTLERERFSLLLALGAPDLVGRAVERLGDDLPLEERFDLAFAVRDHVPTFTAEQRDRYVRFLLDADEADGGHSLRGYVDAMRLRLPPEDRGRSTRAAEPPPSLVPRDDAEPWTAATLLPELPRAGEDRSFLRGKAAYESALCARCHRFDGAGGNGVAPDLTSVSSRFSRAELLEAILDPAAVVSDQYRDTDLVLADGRIVTGRIVAEHGGEFVVRRDALTGARVTIHRRDVLTTRPADGSPMPPGLLDRLTLEQILDLLAYLESRGDPAAPAFRSN